MSESAATSPDLVNRYEAFYRDFETPLMQALRREIDGEDLGLHSFGSPQELRLDVDRLNLTASSRIADLGCGPCGALTFVLATVGCRGTGVDTSAAALRAAQSRAAVQGVADRMDTLQGDLDTPLPFADRSLDAILTIDAVCHLRDRSAFFREVARVLRPGGRFLCADPHVLTGSVSNEDLLRRTSWGYTQVVAPGVNERLLEAAGLRLLDAQDRTAGVLRNAQRKSAVYAAHRADLEREAPWFEYERRQDYLATVARLARDRALARFVYLAVRDAEPS